MSNIEKAMAHLRVIYAYTAFARKRGTGFLGLQAICDIEERASDALTLLEEQKAVEPIPPKDESDLWRCGNCNHQLFRCTHQRYCEMCGQEVKWK